MSSGSMRTACLATLAALSLGACAIRHAADDDRLDRNSTSIMALDGVRWPTRSSGSLQDILEFQPGIRRVIRSSYAFFDERPRGYHYRSRVRVVNTERAGAGVIREFESLLPWADAPVPGASAGLPVTFQYMSSASRLAAGGSDPDDQPWWAEGQRLGASEFRFSPRTGGPPRGIIVHLRSLGGDTYELPVIEEFRRRGWDILSSDFPWATWRGINMRLASVDDVPESAAFFARSIDERLGEWAMAAEASVDYAQHHVVGIGTGSVVVVGFSNGALGAPAIAARLGDRVDGVVLVGGGVDLLRLSQTSELTSGGISISWHGPASHRDSVLESLYADYLRRSSLDPYSTAPLLSDTPVLQLHAALDTIVPAPLGDELHERLGRPDRWTFPVGHKLLFWRLESYAGDIANWVDDAVEKNHAARADRGHLRGPRPVPHTHDAPID